MYELRCLKEEKKKVGKLALLPPLNNTVLYADTTHPSCHGAKQLFQANYFRFSFCHGNTVAQHGNILIWAFKYKLYEFCVCLD